jgi:hypothetical protein
VRITGAYGCGSASRNWRARRQACPSRKAMTRWPCCRATDRGPTMSATMIAKWHYPRDSLRQLRAVSTLVLKLTVAQRQASDWMINHSGLTRRTEHSAGLLAGVARWNEEPSACFNYSWLELLHSRSPPACVAARSPRRRRAFHPPLTFASSSPRRGRNGLTVPKENDAGTPARSPCLPRLKWATRRHNHNRARPPAPS